MEKTEITNTLKLEMMDFMLIDDLYLSLYYKRLFI